MQQTKTPHQNRNDALHELLLKASGIEPRWTMDAYGNVYGWLDLTEPRLLADTARTLAGKVRLCTITAYAEERDDQENRRRIAYHFAQGDTVLNVTVPLYSADTMQKLPVPSITPWFRNADWNEREFIEMFDIEVEGHPNPKRLFLDERLDAGVMSKLIPFSAMANSAGTNTLWERILEAKGVPPEERLPSVVVPSEPIKADFKFTPVAPAPEMQPALATPTLAALAKSAEEATARPKPAPKPEKTESKPEEVKEQAVAPVSQVEKDESKPEQAEKQEVKPSVTASEVPVKDEPFPAPQDEVQPVPVETVEDASTKEQEVLVSETQEPYAPQQAKEETSAPGSGSITISVNKAANKAASAGGKSKKTAKKKGSGKK